MEGLDCHCSLLYAILYVKEASLKPRLKYSRGLTVTPLYIYDSCRCHLVPTINVMNLTLIPAYCCI